MPTTSVRPAVRARVRRDGWLPNQHGAWAMLVVPFALGLIAAGVSAFHLPLLGLSLFGYAAFFAASQWLKAAPGRRSRYLPAVCTYGTLSALLGGVALLLAPPVWRWLPVIIPLLLSALLLAARRNERALLGGALTVAAASILPLVVAFPDPESLLAASMAAWTPTASAAWGAAAASFGYFFGTVLHVKSNIRERGSPAYRRWSVAWHASWTAGSVATAAFGWTPWFLAVFFALATARAAWRPSRPLSPKVLGGIEIGFSAVLLAGLALPH